MKNGPAISSCKHTMGGGGRVRDRRRNDMARIGILTCSNCTQETHCASVVCLGDLRKRRGLFARYAAEEPLDLIGIINCAGCPTVAAPEKILAGGGRV